MGKAAKIAVVALIVIAVYVLTAGLFRVGTEAGINKVNSEASRNTFLRSCESTGATAEQCKCGLRELDEYHDGKFLTVENMQRINTDGYSKFETDAVISCFDEV